MKKNITLITLLLLLSGAAYTQEKKPEKKDTLDSAKKTEITDEEIDDGRIYREEIVEDFENIEFKDSNIIFQKSRFEKYKVSIRDEFPAEINNSKKYLGVKLRGSKSNAIQIKFPPEKKLTIDKYCHSISIWVYGKRFSGELSLFIMDAEGNSHRMLFGKLDFHGWYKLTQRLPSGIIQSDKFLEQKRNIQILSLLYVPGTWYKFGTNIIQPVWQSFYIDDIIAKVREKYKDRQTDDW